MSVMTGLEATTSKFEIFVVLNCKLADIIIILYYTLPVLWTSLSGRYSYSTPKMVPALSLDLC